MAGDAQRIGLWGFVAAAHIVIQTARYLGKQVFAFTRPDDKLGQKFAHDLGEVWAGSSAEAPPEFLDGAIIFAPVGTLVPIDLKAIAKGGVVVCRHSYERYSRICLRTIVGRTGIAIGCQSHPPRWGRFFGSGSQNSDSDSG